MTTEKQPDRLEDDTTADPARARAEMLDSLKPEDPKTQRVIWCWKEMTHARWIPGSSHLKGATKFKVSVRTMESDAAEASRFIRLMTLADSELRDLCILALMRAMQMGEGAADKARGADSITKAVAVMAGIKGYEAPKTLHIGGIGLDDLSKAAEAAKGNE